MVRQLSLFSENEFMEDISTKDLRYEDYDIQSSISSLHNLTHRYFFSLLCTY